MQWADILRRAAGVTDRVGQGSSRWCLGRFICLNCPRDHHLPPFQPFGLLIHIREHLRNYPRHAIAWWCWDHCQLEQGGYANMTSPVQPGQVVLGTCHELHNPWVVTTEAPTCLFCGSPPAHVIPFTPAGGSLAGSPTAAAEPPEPPDQPIVIGVTCPHCDRHIRLSISDDGIAILSSPPGPPAEEVAGVPQPPAPTAPLPAEEGASSTDPLSEELTQLEEAEGEAPSPVLDEAD